MFQPFPSVCLQCSFWMFVWFFPTLPFLDFGLWTFCPLRDLICCSGLCPLNCTALDLPISDHMSVSFNVSLSKLNMIRFTLFCKSKNIDLSALFNGMSSKGSLLTSDELVSNYNDGLHSLLNGMQMTPNSTSSLPLSLPLPFLTVNWKLNPGFPAPFSNLTVIKLLTLTLIVFL